MTEFVSILIQWYPPGQFGPNECDLMRAYFRFLGSQLASKRAEMERVYTS